MSSAINITPHSQKRKGGRAPLPEVEENFTRLPPGPGDRTERAVCKHCSKERSWHTTELVKHLDKCAQYTPSKRQKYTRPWRIERPSDGQSPNQSQSQQPSPRQSQNGNIDLSSRNVMLQWAGGMSLERPPTSNYTDGTVGEDQQHQDGADGQDQPQPSAQARPTQPNHHIPHTPSQPLDGNADYTNAATTNHRTNRQSQHPQTRPSARPPPVDDPDQRLHSFIEYERGAIAWQNRAEDLDAIEAWLQHHRFDIEDIKEITETRWADSWQLKLGDLYRIKRDVQTFKIFAAR